MPQKKIKNTNQKSSTTRYGAKLTQSKPKASPKAAKSLRKRNINNQLKDKPIGSAERFAAYKRLGLKQDHTTTGRKIGGPATSGVKGVGGDAPSAKATTTKRTKVKTNRKLKKAAKLRTKGQAALKAGNLKKARRLVRRYKRSTK